MPQDPILASLRAAASCPVLEAYPLDKDCTLRLGGPARYYSAPENPECLRGLILAAGKLKLAWTVLGGGSNTLFRDEGYPGLVLSTRGLNQALFLAPDRVQAGAGVPVAGLTELAVQRSLAGLEWAGGLPGTLGGGVFMNAKCYGGEFSKVVESVKALDNQGKWLEFSGPGCGFGYKDSVFQRQSLVITQAVLKLAPGQSKEISAKTRSCEEDRRAKGQFDFPSAGCVFKNPYELNTPAGKIIEALGLKGRVSGGAKIFEKHANFIVNTGSATAKDVLALLDLIKGAVREKHGYDLKEEIRILP